MGTRLRMLFFLQLSCIAAVVLAGDGEKHELIATPLKAEDAPGRLMRSDANHGQVNVVLNHAGASMQETRHADTVRDLHRAPEDGYYGGAQGGSHSNVIVPHAVHALNIKVDNHDFHARQHKDHHSFQMQRPEGVTGWHGKTDAESSKQTQNSKTARREAHDFELEEAEDLDRTLSLGEVDKRSGQASGLAPLLAMPASDAAASVPSINAFPASTGGSTLSSAELLKSPSMMKDALARKFGHAASQPGGFHPFPNAFNNDVPEAPSQPTAQNVPAPSPQPTIQAAAQQDRIDTAIAGAGTGQKDIKQGIMNLDGTITDDPVVPPPSPHPSPTPLAY